MEAEQRNNISVSPGTRTHDSTKPVFFSYVWESGLLYHIFYFLWCDVESFWHLLTKENGQHMHTKEIIQLSLEDIIIGVVTTKRHLLNIIVYMLIIGKVYLQALRASKTQLSIYGTFA